MNRRALNQFSAGEAARAIAAGEITSEALVRACLDRIAAREHVVKAWAAIDFDHALAMARASDRTPRRGPLHGVPIGVKDVLATHDFPTQMGSPIYDGFRTPCDASCVALARAAGAIIPGKTVTCEFAGIAPGTTTNPRNSEFTPGGSSSGSAAAVADFMVPAAFGTQTGGSVLRPASFCGIVGYKPTFNTFNREGLKFAAESLDTIGLLTRSVEDACLLTHALTGRAPVALRAPDAPPRVGLCRTLWWETKTEAATRARVEEAADKARAAGATVVDFELPADFTRISEAREIINNVERARSLASEWALHRGALSPQMAKTIESGLATTDADYRDALRFLEAARARLDALLADFDCLLAPAVNGEAPRGLEYTGDAALQGPWTALHTPAISIPAGSGPNGLPVGVQLVAARYADQKLLEMALWMQQKARVAAPAPEPD